MFDRVFIDFSIHFLANIVRARYDQFIRRSIKIIKGREMVTLKSVSTHVLILMLMSIIPLHAVWVINKPFVTPLDARLDHLREEVPGVKLLLGYPVNFVKPGEGEAMELNSNERLVSACFYDVNSEMGGFIHCIVCVDDLIEIDDQLQKSNLSVCVEKTTVYQHGVETLVLYNGTVLHGEKINEKWYKVFLVTGLEGLVSVSDVIETD
jgi:hypothetical protein